MCRPQPIFLYPADWLARNEAASAQEEAHGLAGFQGMNNLQARIGALLAFDARPGLGDAQAADLHRRGARRRAGAERHVRRTRSSHPGRAPACRAWGAHAINVTEPAAFNALLLDFLSCVPAKA